MSDTKFTIKESDMNRREVTLFTCPACNSWEYACPKPEDMKVVICFNCFELIVVSHN